MTHDWKEERFGTGESFERIGKVTGDWWLVEEVGQSKVEKLKEEPEKENLFRRWGTEFFNTEVTEFRFTESTKKRSEATVAGKLIPKWEEGEGVS